ncbi:8146_t:CDS:2 [Ambispora leptoticha]|uniref:8146_t:CDS:1 n=1 Tax=Ambispora leptoticha TaxID=144679 RepID=A0A9N9AWJ2_9GLOM|nr:8146_t:CDS:2 [Ambispora leptoticha]
MHHYFFQNKIISQSGTLSPNDYLATKQTTSSLTPDLHEEFFDVMDAFNDVQVEEAVANRII